MADNVSTPRGYLDAALVIGLEREDLDATEQDALYRLLEMHKRDRVRLVTSGITQEELRQYAGDNRLQQAIYHLLQDVPLVAEGDVSGGLLGLGVWGGEDVLFSALKALLPDLADARHVYQAIKNDVEYFVTADERTILRHADELWSQYELLAVLPSTLLADLS